MKELTTIQARLLALQDEAYRAFHKSLVPTLQQELIGVRVPQVRKLAKELAGTQESEAFLNEASPPVLRRKPAARDLAQRRKRILTASLSGIERFLPYVDNWAVCDAFSPKVFAKHPQEVLACIRRWLSSGRTYTIRFGVDMLMQFYLGDHFSPEQLRWVGTIESGEHYVNMARAWYFATALAKQQPDTLSYLLENRLDVWTHNKTIQKAIESYRISPELKTFLRTQKR